MLSSDEGVCFLTRVEGALTEDAHVRITHVNNVWTLETRQHHPALEVVRTTKIKRASTRQLAVGEHALQVETDHLDASNTASKRNITLRELAAAGVTRSPPPRRARLQSRSCQAMRTVYSPASWC